ncbi:hypothetical protein TSAR_008933, partial [Trichomalopsis sarcophagae]
ICRIGANMTEESQQSTETSTTIQQTDQNASNTTTEIGKTKEGKKEKCRPMTKVVIRRLPPSMTQEQFLEQVSPLPEYDYMYFAKADMSLGQYAFSRAYIDFVDPQDIFAFREKFDNYVFVDAKGTEYPAVVEYAPFQRVPKKRVGKKKDLKCGTIESDPYYISFLESLKNQEVDSANAQPKTEYSFQPSDHAPKKVTTTPLLDFLKQRKQEKQRLRDEKREEKRRRDIERKRNKDEPMVSKVLKNMEDRETRDKDSIVNRENKENKDDKEKTVHKDVKNRNKKEEKYRDKMGRDIKVPAKNFREDRIKDKEVKQSKKHEDKKFYNKKDESHAKEDRVHEKEESAFHKEKKLEEKRGKSYEKMRLEKKRLAEIQKKQNIEQTLEELNYDNNDKCDEDYEDAGMSISIEKNESENRFKHRNKKSGEVTKCDEAKAQVEQQNDSSRKTKNDLDQIQDTEQSIDNKLQEICERLSQSTLETNDTKKSPVKSRIAKRRSSLESGGDNGTGVNVGGSGGKGSGSGDDSRDHDGACLRRHKSLDGGNDNNLQKNGGDEKEKDKKDPRLERRIRNKDRPAMEIYRPGMGKFSKQRMEREKGNEERVTPSQSPTPTSGNPNSYKSGKPNGSEVRSMTFKRSVSRDM